MFKQIVSFLSDLGVLLLGVAGFVMALVGVCIFPFGVALTGETRNLPLILLAFGMSFIGLLLAMIFGPDGYLFSKKV